METVYQYDHQGYYVGETIAYQGLPHNCTTVKPKKQTGCLPQWTGSSWKQIEDHRQKKDVYDCIIENTGTPYWLPSDTWKSPPRYMSEIGPLPEEANRTRPEANPEEVLMEAKRSKLTEIHRGYETALVETILNSNIQNMAEVREAFTAKRTAFEIEVQQATTVKAVEAIQVAYIL